jgi:hypothetical protein
MIKKLLTLGLLVFLIVSCEKETIGHFEIENRTKNTIDSLRIVPSGYESDYYISISPEEIKRYDCNMTDIADADGEYKLDYKFDTSNFVSETFGYYTNGYQIEKKIIIIFETDSILYDSQLKDY